MSLAIPARADLRARPPETDRLFFLPVEPSDGPEIWFAVERSRPVLQAWLPWVEYTTDAGSSVRFAEACAADWDQGKAVRFGIRDRATRTFLGIVGLENCVHLHRSCELGYWLRTDAHKRGFMSEAVRFSIDFSFRQMGVHRIKVAAATDNHPSLKVIQRAGFRFEGISRQAEWCNGRWLDHVNYALLSTDTPSGGGHPPQGAPRS